MTWVKLDDGFPDHPKVVGLSDRAFRAHVRAMCYCGRFSPGVGELPASALRTLGASAAVMAELIRAGLWDDTVNGLYIHDFDLYHPKPNREAKVEAGRQGGLASGIARRSKAEAETKQSASDLVERKRTPVPDPALIASNEAKEGAPKRAPARRKAKADLIPLTDDERKKLVADFRDLPDVEFEIDRALAHDAHLKYPTGQYLYVRGWLRDNRRPPIRGVPTPIREARNPTAEELFAMDMAGAER